jgi:hypothetical protein
LTLNRDNFFRRVADYIRKDQIRNNTIREELGILIGIIKSLNLYYSGNVTFYECKTNEFLR